MSYFHDKKCYLVLFEVHLHRFLTTWLKYTEHIHIYKNQGKDMFISDLLITPDLANNLKLFYEEYVKSVMLHWKKKTSNISLIKTCQFNVKIQSGKNMSSFNNNELNSDKGFFKLY